MSNTHEFRNFHLLKKCPPDIDPKEWADMISEIDRANLFHISDHPIQIDIELNSGCNMNCPFCLHGYETIKNKNMGVDTYHKIIDEAVSIGVKSLKLNYINEPMLRKDLEDCIRYARDKGILNIYMATNGTLLNEKRRKSIIESGITKIFVSIDAASSAVYDAQRLDGRYQQVINNITSLIQERNALGLEFPIVRVNFLKTAINIHEAEAFEKFWIDRADIIAFQKMDEVPDRKTGLTIKNENDEDGCQFPFKQLVVETNGDILPCCKMSGKKLKIGNIKDMTLKEAWDSDAMKTLHEIHSTDGWKSHDICRSCIMGD